MPTTQEEPQHVPYVLAPIHHPVLSEWSAKAIATFQKERAIYELKLADLPEKPKPVSLRSSLDSDLLGALLKLKTLKNKENSQVTALADVTDDIINKWMSDTIAAAKAKFSVSDLLRIVDTQSTKNGTHENLVDATRSFFLRLQVAADNLCPDSLSDHAAFIIPQIIRQLDPTVLQGTIRDRVRADEERLLKGADAYINFVRECVSVADAMDGLNLNGLEQRRGTKRGAEGGANGPLPPKRRSRPNREYRRTKVLRERPLHPGNEHNTPPAGHRSGQRGTDRTGTRRGTHMDRASPTEKPRCLNDQCAGYHFMRDCTHPTSTPDKKKELISDYLARRNQQARARKLGDGLTSFNATLGPGAVTAQLAADTQSNVCLLPTSTMNQLRQTGVEVVKLPIPVAVRLAMGAQGASFPAQGMLTSKASVDVSLQVAHGRALQLREVTFYTGEGVDACLLSGPVLTACGLDIESVLVAAAANEMPINCHNITSATPEGNSVARRLLTYSELHAGAADGTSEADDVLLEFGEDDDSALRSELNARVDEAIQAGFPIDRADSLRKIVLQYTDVFALRLGPRAPADVPPMRIRLKPGARPHRAKVRPYPGRRREVLGHMTSTMIQYGFAYRNPQSEWACAPLLVPKAPPVLYRFTVDLRPANIATIPEIWPLPHLDTVTAQLRGSTCFASLDFCSGYWQLPLHPKDQHVHSFITPDGVFTPTRTMQGAVNSGANFQRCVAPLFEELLPGHVLAYLDDIMLHFADESAFLKGLESSLALCRTRRLTLSARKTTLFTRRAKWCGRIITAQGTSLDPRRASALRNMSEPQTPLELSSFLYAITWMSKHIPRFASLASPLRDSLNDAYRRAGSRTNAALKRVPQLLWGREQREAFVSLQEQLRNTIELAHPNPEQAICIHTDASEHFWSSIITQTDPNELPKPRAKQRHEPLVFASGAFTGSQVAWSTFDKEAFAIFRSFLDHGYLMEGSPHNTRLFTDHRNLMYVYSPTLFDATLGKHVISRVQRWAIFIAKFRYTIEHVPGSDNVIADMFTRWARGYRDEPGSKVPWTQASNSTTAQANGISASTNKNAQTKLTAKRLRMGKAEYSTLSVMSDTTSPDFEWPSTKDVKALQDKHAGDPRQSAPTSKNNDDLITTSFGQIWIPAALNKYEEDICNMHVRILCIGHAGASGHRSTDATVTRIRSTYWWKGMEDDVRAFVQHCIHCIASRNGERIPRPLASALHATKPFDVIHFDYLAIGASNFTIEGRKNPKYLLLIKDDLTSFCWLVPTCAPDAISAADALARWEASFGSASFWVSDGGSHFTAAILKHLRSGYRHIHHVTTAYCPQANGTIERLCREVLRGLRALESEFRLGSQDWPSLVNIVQGVLNSSYLKRLRRSPIEAAFGRAEVTNILRPTGSRQLLTACSSISQARAQQLLAVESLQTRLESIHKETAERVTSRRAREIINYNKKVNVRPSCLEPGDFVMVRLLDAQIPSKTKCKWTGPRRVIATVEDHEEVYEVEHIVTGKRSKIHASRLAAYREGGTLSAQDICRLKEYAEHSDSEYFVVEKMHDLRRSGRTVQVQVEWLGYPEEESWTWEPINQLGKDVPEMVNDYLETQKDHPLHKVASKAIGAV